MRPDGDKAEVAACCAEWRVKSKLNYEFHELVNSIGRGLRCRVRRKLSRQALLEVRPGGRGCVRLLAHGRSGDLLVFVHGKQQVIAEVVAAVNSAASQVEK
jgi:hypothetical protein